MAGAAEWSDRLAAKLDVNVAPMAAAKALRNVCRQLRERPQVEMRRAHPSKPMAVEAERAD